MNQIGEYTFRSLSGNPELPKESIATVARAGVRGKGFWLQGVRGQPFALRSLTACDDLIDGRMVFGDYCAMIGGGPYMLTWNDLTLSAAEGMKVVVLNVKQTALYEVVNDTDGAGALLECEWNLDLLEYSFDPEPEA